MTDEMYFDMDGKPISMQEWGEMFERSDFSKVIEQTYLEFNVRQADGKSVPGYEVFVSTVWLGLNHGTTVDGKPLIFETMTFTKRVEDDEFDFGEEIAMSRYPTMTMAREGHEQWVAKLRSMTTEEFLALSVMI